MILIVALSISAVFATSCNPNQEEPVELLSTATALESQITVTTTPTTSVTPTITPTPKKAENFENCLTMRFSSTYDIYGSNTQGDLITENDVVHDVSSWKINKDGVVTEITNPQVIDGLVYFSINGSKITMTEGAMLYIELYKDPPDYDTAYILMYSPTTNTFILLDWSQPQLYPMIAIDIYPDSTVSLTNVGGVTRNYQGDYCVEQDNDAQCVIYTLPNGDEYGYGVNKDGEVSCMQLWIEETETE